MEKNRSTAFFINGGAGRVLASIPALENFRKENPEDDFIIVCEGGTEFYKGHPDLDKRSYDVWHKNLYLEKIKDRKCVSPEPYRIWQYYNQQASLGQAFDIEINNLDAPRELPKPTLKLNREEVLNGEITLNEVRQITGKDKIIIVQPFGRGISYRDGVFNDSTARSIEFEDLISIVKKLHDKNHAVMIMAEMQIDFGNNDIKVPIPTPTGITLRQWAGLIRGADYFIGCDSVGQHIADAVGTASTVITGSTYPINISHPENKKFTIIDMGEKEREYSPIRIAPDEMCDRLNDGLMKMQDSDIDKVIKSVQLGLKNYGKESAIKVKAKLKNEGQPQGEICPVHGVAHEHGHTHQMQTAQPTPVMPGMMPQGSTAMSSQFGVVPPFMQQKETKE